MANKISLTSGSVLNGSPITFEISPTVVAGLPSFHRVVIDMEVGMSGIDPETFRMYEPVLAEGKAVEFNTQSVFKALRDAHEYSPEDTEFPVAKFRLKVYDEYMTEGVVHTTSPIYYPSADTYASTIFGELSDMERWLSTGTKAVQRLSCKPTIGQQLATVGEQLVYAKPYDTPQLLTESDTLTNPVSVVADIVNEGLQTIGGIEVYAMPAEDARNRVVFRFINSFGVMESVSIPCPYKQTMPTTTNSFVVTRRETFNRFSRSVVRKEKSPEKWTFMTDPLNEEWMRWYLHEFLMAEHVWMFSGGVWLPCNLTSGEEDEVVIVDRTTDDMYTLTFKAELGINGNPFPVV